jgi:hypothetical protein
VAPLVDFVNKIGPKAWDMGPNVSLDEETIGFQGRHADKLRITYKAEGDGFQCDAICENGFTYGVYFRNAPPPKKYVDQGLSPLHARCMWLFDKLEHRKHRVWMDNLYMSAKFARAAYCHPNSVLISGVTRKSGRGVPSCVLQEEQKNKKAQMRVRGTVKVAVLRGDLKCPDLLCVSVYDTKPVNFLSMSADSVRWIRKERKAFNPDRNKEENIKFLRLNINDDYNNYLVALI